MISSLEALERLREGNRRFASGRRSSEVSTSPRRRRKLASGQAPFAIVLGCSDSRVPPEIVFDQGLGDLFVVRVAGNIASPPEIGSVEFAASQFGSRLVVVLGHSRCGAVLATLETLGGTSEGLTPNLQSIVECIAPSVEPLPAAEPSGDSDALVERAIRDNARAQASHLRRGSALLEHLIHTDDLLIVCAEYSLETGVVDFFHGLPDEGRQG